MLDKIKKLIVPDDGDDIEFTDHELTPEERASVEYMSVKNKNIDTKNPAKMILFEPRSFEDAEEIGYHLKCKRACVVNLHRVTNDIAQRIIDFLTGSVFALDGTISKIGDNVILCAPKDMGVAGDISLTKE